MTLVEVVGVQQYVFSSPRLRDAVAASQVVRTATAQAVLDECLSGLDGRVVMAASGVAALLFDSGGDDGEPGEFAARYSRRLLEEAPGLEVVVVHQAYEPGGLAGALLVAGARLARAKLERPPPQIPPGLGVTAVCQETGGPATGTDRTDPEDPSRPLSEQVLARRRKLQEAVQRWQDMIVDPGLVLPLMLDRLGATPGQASYLGMVQVDGNAVGQRLIGWLSRCAEAGTPDNEVEDRARGWSQALHAACETVVQRVVDRVVAAVHTPGREPGGWWVRGRPERLCFALHEENGKVFLPVRPILAGGDDVLLVCDGRIALDLAACAVDAFAGAELPALDADDDDEPLTASAGVAILPLHTPFPRAQALAGQLTVRAKAAARHHREETGQALSAMDWHAGLPPLGAQFDDLRAGLEDRGLTLRPYLLDPDGPVGSWQWFVDKVLGGQDPALRGPSWSSARSKLHGLPAVARQGWRQVADTIQAWQIPRPDLQLPTGLDTPASEGFYAGDSPLPEAVELVDLALLLEPATPGPPR